MSNLPAHILIAILIIAVVIAAAITVPLLVVRLRQEEEVQDQPEEVKRQSDAPEMPSEGQENKPIDEVDESG